MPHQLLAQLCILPQGTFSAESDVTASLPQGRLLCTTT